MRISLQEAADKLREAGRIVVTAHVNPDGDALGSSLALYHLLQKLGKTVQVLIDDDIPDAFGFLPGIEVIAKPDEEKYQADLLVLLDVSMDRVGRVIERCPAPILNIDHHITNDEKADYLYLDADRAATAEIVYQLAGALQVVPDKAAATCIYTGMSTDTGNFRYSNTTPFTMRAAADMIEAGAEPHVVSEALEKRSFKEVQDRARAMQTIEVCADGKIAGLYIGNDLYETLDTTEGEDYRYRQGGDSHEGGRAGQVPCQHALQGCGCEQHCRFLRGRRPYPCRRLYHRGAAGSCQGEASGSGGKGSVVSGGA